MNRTTALIIALVAVLTGVYLYWSSGEFARPPAAVNPADTEPPASDDTGDAPGSEAESAPDAPATE